MTRAPGGRRQLWTVRREQAYPERETEAAVERSLRSVRSEIEVNRERLAEAAAYHAELSDTLRALERLDREREGEGRSGKPRRAP